MLCLNESWLNPSDTLSLKMFTLTEEYLIFRCDRNNKGCGVVLIVHTKLKPFSNNYMVQVLILLVRGSSLQMHSTLYQFIGHNGIMYQDFLKIFCLF